MKRKKNENASLSSSSSPANVHQQNSNVDTVYIVRWAASGSKVWEWNDEALRKVQTDSQLGLNFGPARYNEADAKSWIEVNETVENNCSRTEAILGADGLCKDGGVHGKAYRTPDLAMVGMKEFYDEQVNKIRSAIMDCCDLDKKEYDLLVMGEEGYEGQFSESTEVMSYGSDYYVHDAFHAIGILSMFIEWGCPQGYDASKYSISKYHDRDDMTDAVKAIAALNIGDLMPCAIEIHTQVTTWIEKLELEDIVG